MTPCTQLALRRLARPIARCYDDELASVGLNGSQYLLLSQLAQRGPLRAVDLADGMEVQPSTLSRNLRPLLEAGLVDLAPGPDARSRLVRLTPVGVARQREGEVRCAAAERTLRAALGASRIAALHSLAAEIHQLLIPEHS